MTRPRALTALAAAAATAHLLAGGAACDGPINSPLAPRPRDLGYFICEVQPVLARQCSFPACHGSPGRALSLVAPGRMRLSDEYPIARLATPSSELAAGTHPPLTAAELRYNYEQAMAFVSPDGDAGRSLLLGKPLAVGAGGLYHAPNADVFESVSAPGYQIIARWLQGDTRPQGCE